MAFQEVQLRERPGGLSLLILTLVFRSLVVPLVATGGFLLSVGAAFGATVAVHQWGWFGGLLGVTQPGPLLSFMPIILIGVLFGLVMDYQMFLAVREALACLEPKLVLGQLVVERVRRRLAGLAFCRKGEPPSSVRRATGRSWSPSPRSDQDPGRAGRDPVPPRRIVG